MTQHDSTPQEPDRATEAETASDPQPTDPETVDQHDGAPAADTTVYVRGRRSPTLAFWVLLALVVPAIAGLVAAPFFGVTSAGGLLSFSFLAVLSIGMPLAALAALVDLILDRRRRRRPAR